jgi:pimeloyl-ACP methyl ester carboxylesterase
LAAFESGASRTQTCIESINFGKSLFGSRTGRGSIIRPLVSSTLSIQHASTVHRGAGRKHSSVVSIDLAWHGESGLGRKAWTMASFGEDVAAVVVEIDAKEVILIGHSMGGDVIVEAARRLRSRITGLVWVDTHKQLGNPRTPEQLYTAT